MTKELFYETVKAQVSKRQNNCDVQLEETIKNNDTIRVGIVIRKPGDSYVPTIYLDGFYEYYENGEYSIDDVVRHVLDINRRTVSENLQLSIDRLYDWESAKDKLFFKLVAKKGNIRYLKEGIYQEYLDLVLVVFYCANFSENGIESIAVKKALADRWQVSEQEVLKQAAINTERLFPTKLSKLSDVVFHMLEIEEKEMALQDMPTMLIASNQVGVNGATVITYDGFLKSVYEKIGTPFFVLPSSVHETLFIPETRNNNPQELQEMVQSINEEHVSIDERLSNTVYYYNGEVLSVVAAEKEE